MLTAILENVKFVLQIKIKLLTFATSLSQVDAKRRKSAEDAHIGRRLLYALCLALRNFANFEYSQEHGNGRCPRGMVIPICKPSRKICGRGCCRRVICILAWGLRIARSTVLGNAKASEGRTGERFQALTLFSYVFGSLLNNNSVCREFANAVQGAPAVLAGWHQLGKLIMLLQHCRNLFVMLCLFCLHSAVALGQGGGPRQLETFSIVDFHQDPFATTAKSEEYGKQDGNGDQMAIIRVMSNDPSVSVGNWNAFMFNFGNMRHEAVVHGDELWVYVQKNARRVTITREGYAPIKNWDLNTTIQPGATYVMKISFDRVLRIVEKELTKQMLLIRVNPAVGGALVSLTREGEQSPMETQSTDVNGCVSQNLPFGTYFYKISLASYKTKQGRIKLTTSDSTHVETVSLEPNFGHLEIRGTENAMGAKVFVDQKEVGTVPYTSDVKWDCGQHELTLVKDLYKSYSQTFTIKQGETTVLIPRMEANFAETTLLVDGNAEIYIDGQPKAKGKWTGPLKAGKYLVECTKPNHRKTSREITVEVDVASTITLDAPIPITGFLAVRTNPVGATITIDGKDYGKTPQTVKDLLVGRHKVELSMPNYKTETRNVTIEEGKETGVDVKLSSMGIVEFTSSPSGAYIYLDGVEIGSTTLKKEMGPGFYNVTAKRYGYKTYSKRMYIDVANPYVRIKLAKQHMRKNAFYLGADGQFGALAAFGGTMGFYAGGFNMEGFCMKGFGSETVYWCSSGEADAQPSEPVEEELKLGLCAGGKVGYGVIVGTRLRFTPQVGCTYLSAKGDQTKAYALSGTVGLRMEVALASRLGLSVTPEFAFGLKQSDSFERLSAVLPGMEDWTKGFCCKVELFFF